jgi:hypothetical protein
MRKPSARPTRNGGYLHIFDDAPLIRLPRPPVPKPCTDARRESVEQLSVVYESFLSHLVLADAHRQNLLARGLSDTAIERGLYRSLPPRPFSEYVSRALAKDFDLRGVPGFYRVGAEWRTVDTGAGFYVPVRDSRGRIQAFQIRRDEGEPRYLWFSSANRTDGCSSGAPVHFAAAHLSKDADTVTLTEGALKGEIITHLTRSPVIAAAGVSNFGADFAETLKKAFPNLRRATLAFDADVWSNNAVFNALKRLGAQLERAHFKVSIRTWPQAFKGFDDFLVGQLRREREEVAA